MVKLNGTVVLTILLIFASLTPVEADNFSANCIFTASTDANVSLGKPVALERLAHKSKIRIGVLLLQSEGSSKREISNSDKNDYLDAAESIGKLSNNKVKIQIKFLGSFLPSDSFSQAYFDRPQAYQELDENKGTYSFVRKVLQTSDALIDFSNLDSVILEADNSDLDIAEAMQLFRGSEGNVFRNSSKKFFESIKTKEGIIDNAILLNNHKTAKTIAHEIMHNFGLVDLYGSMDGPGWLSMMGSGSNVLLNYEKAVLGWFPPSQFACQDMSNFLKQDSIDNVIKFKDIKQDSIFLLKNSEKSGYFFEVLNRDGKSWLVTYQFEQNRRPPMKVFFDWSLTYSRVLDLQDPKSIGLSYKTPDFQLMVTDIQKDFAVLNVIPSTLIGSTDALTLKQLSESNRDRALTALVEVPKKVVPGKLITLICIRGTNKKIVTSIKLKCPAGYRIK